MLRFGDFPEKYTAYSQAKTIILPVPFDKTSSWIKGSANGPQAILEASENMYYYDIETKTEVYKTGIHVTKPVQTENSKEMVKESYDRALELLDDNKFVITIGGEHTVSLGPIQAHIKKCPNLSVLQLDAHADLLNTYEDNPLSHACVMARVGELTKKIVAVGIRSVDKEEIPLLKDAFFAHELKPDWQKKVVEQLSDDVYVTIDLDVFDPSIMPSTGTPEPGGLDWYAVTKLLKLVAQNKRVVGFDIVELCPGESKAPDLLAAKLLYTFLSYINKFK